MLRQLVTPLVSFHRWKRAISTLALGLWAVALLSACAPDPTPPALPATQWLRVQISPSLEKFSDLYSACTPPGIGLAVQQVTGTSFEADQVDLSLRWGAPAESPGYMVNVGEEELVVVVHPDNLVPDITLSALQTTLAGALPGWDWDYLGQPPQNLSVYAYPPSSDIQAVLASWLLAPQQALPREVDVAPGPAEVREAVAADPGALGFLPRRWVDQSVRIVPVSGLPTGSWTQPILALSAVEPQGPAREWLLCVQQGMR